MLQLSATLINRAVLSLRTGGIIAQVTAPIINPNNLKIEGFLCDDRFSKNVLILLTQDIRDNSPQGYIVNDHDVLTDPDELVRLHKILKLHFELVNKPVTTVNKKKLGKVNDYAVETSSMYIKKLYVGQSLLKSFSGGQLSIDRTQIVEITNRRIVVQDPLQPIKDTAPASVPVAT
jgi:sporulation protein YlmC with PRC-barrel domain